MIGIERGGEGSMIRQVIRCVSIIAVAGLLVCACVGLAEGMKPGFRSHKWGDPVPNGAIKSKSQGAPPLVYYEIQTEKLAIGKVKLDQLLFGYFKGKLTLVSMHTTDPASRAVFLATLRSSWGTGEKVDLGLKADYTCYQWKTRHPSLGDTTALYLDIGAPDNRTVLGISSERLSQAAKHSLNVDDDL